ncbi:disulfide bond formation protein B [mine drainage metagenome]|uniref:Disulfide bond formation protein B n=1 Tax=mine drainage metagenome TaxID=410659 RepID=A0A1J5SJN0_9ZZZZ
MLKRWNSISKRWLYLIGALIVAILFCSALYLQYVLHQDPCPLCMVQRVIFIAIGALFFIAALLNAGPIASRIYSILIAFLALGGVAAASRHIWIQHLPKDQVPACGPGLDFMLKHFPMSDVWQELMHGSGECAAKGWTFLTLGIPEWSLVWFVLLGVFSILVGWKKR